jgi:murein DD-endopeptidase MepM/ murein hydrolase activator NlpD
MMNIIIVSKFFRTPKKLSFDDPKVATLTGAAVFVLLALVFALGMISRGIDGPAKAEISRLQTQLDQQTRDLNKAKADAQIEINAIAARVGELQVQANRLNALGGRLTQDGKLTDGEFNFDKLPGAGGNEVVAEDVKSQDLLSDLNALQVEFNRSGRQLSVLEAMMFNQHLELSRTPSHMPGNGYITSHFGGRSDPFTGGRAMHKGIDLDANIGDPVKAAADGIVGFVGVKNGYGNVVEVDHGNGYTTLYAHNSAFTVKVGDLVRAGQQIAKAGNTGRSTGAHIHFEVHQNGVAVNPLPYLESIKR